MLGCIHNILSSNTTQSTVAAGERKRAEQKKNARVTETRRPEHKRSAFRNADYLIYYMCIESQRGKICGTHAINSSSHGVRGLGRQHEIELYGALWCSSGANILLWHISSNMLYTICMQNSWNYSLVNIPVFIEAFVGHLAQSHAYLNAFRTSKHQDIIMVYWEQLRLLCRFCVCVRFAVFVWSEAPVRRYIHPFYSHVLSAPVVV